MDSIEKLSKFCLVACDQSYQPDIQIGVSLSPYFDSGAIDIYPNTMPASFFDPVFVGLSQWRVADRVNDTATGFGATIYKRTNSDGKVDFIVGMQGTRGPSPQDWSGNLGFAVDKWQSNDGGQELMARLRDPLTGD